MKALSLARTQGTKTTARSKSDSPEIHEGVPCYCQAFQHDTWRWAVVDEGERGRRLSPPSSRKTFLNPAAVRSQRENSLFSKVHF